MKYEYFLGSEGDFYGASDTDLVAMHSFHGLAPMFSKSMPSELTIGYFIKGRRKPITEPVWDGEGLPPVGCHCEVKVGKDIWNLCHVVFSDNSSGVAFVYLGGDEENYVGSVDCVSAKTGTYYFRPIRSPEDVARNEAVNQMLIIEGEMQDSYQPHELIAAIYEAIAAGKIPGVKLEVK